MELSDVGAGTLPVRGAITRGARRWGAGYFGGRGGGPHDAQPAGDWPVKRAGYSSPAEKRVSVSGGGGGDAERSVSYPPLRRPVAVCPPPLQPPRAYAAAEVPRRSTVVVLRRRSDSPRTRSYRFRHARATDAAAGLERKGPLSVSTLIESVVGLRATLPGVE